MWFHGQTHKKECKCKGPSGVIGITKRKEAVLKWSILKHMKMKYNNFLYDPCNMSDDDEYSIHQGFSSSGTALDELQVQQFFFFFFQYQKTWKSLCQFIYKKYCNLLWGGFKAVSFPFKSEWGWCDCIQ